MVSVRFLANASTISVTVRVGAMLMDVSAGSTGLAMAGMMVLNWNGTIMIGRADESITSISVGKHWLNKPPTVSSAMAKVTFLPSLRTSSTTGPTSILSLKTSTSRSTTGMRTKDEC